MEQITDLLDQIAPLLYIVVPAAAGVWFKLREKIKEKEGVVKRESLDKRKEQFRAWAYDESRATIKKIKDLCNLYKDKGSMDLVNYLQIENGTVTAAKIHNMYVSCLAEDSRLGNLPKLSGTVQRLSYGTFTEFTGDLGMTQSKDVAAVTVDTLEGKMPVQILSNGAIKSYMFLPVFDLSSNLVGTAVFYYSEENYNGTQKDSNIKLLEQFKTSIEHIFFEFATSRAEKIEELKLEEGDVL